MKARLLCLIVPLFLIGCFLISRPTDTVKSFIAASEKGDVDKMTGLFSSKAIQKRSLHVVRSNNQSWAELSLKEAAAGHRFHMEDVEETSTPEGTRVSFVYKNDAGTESIRAEFDLSKEGSAWKIDEIRRIDREERANPDTPTSIDLGLAKEPAPVPPLPLSEKGKTETETAPGGKTISGGVLNEKAISLPKPQYPPVAKAAKASGTVVVQVTVDENGNVIAAHAVSGHPLLQAAAIAAARSAKFSPTKLSGQPVKVTGVITYQFVAE